MSPPDIEMMTVTGKLMRLHLDEHKIAIYYQPTGRILDCYYDIEIEDFIIGNLKDLIQVTGHVQLDASGHPEKIIDANSISELDLSQLNILSCQIASVIGFENLLLLTLFLWAKNNSRIP